MNRRKTISQTGNRRLVNTVGLQEYLSSGRANSVRFGTEAGARIQIGRSVFWDLSRIDKHIEEVAE